MMLMSIITFTSLILTVIYLLHKYISSNFNYWKKRNIFYIKPKPFFGNCYEIIRFKTTIGEHLANLYKTTTEPFFGIFVFGFPYLVVKSPEILKAIMIKDFEYFNDRNASASEGDPVSSHMLFFSKNPDWKVIRTKLTPIFTSGKLKLMLPLINNVGEELVSYINQNLSSKSLDAKEICAKYSTDVIAKCAFAINAKSLKIQDSEFRKYGQMIFDFNWQNAIRLTSASILPEISKVLRMKALNPRSIDFLRDKFTISINKREQSKTKGNDLIDLVVELKSDKEFCDKVDQSDDKLLAQAVQFYVAGFETISAAIAYTLYELCLQTEIQNKVRLEIKNTIRTHGSVTYEALQDMTYLQMVISETLRKYPVLGILDRKCNAAYKIPGTSIVLDKGTNIMIPIYALHYDPQYFPDPHKFIPERFETNKTVPFAYMPFGIGPRNCIGGRFGAFVTKVGLVHILSEIKVDRAPETPVPVQFEPKSLILASKVGLPIIFKKIDTKAE